MEERLPSSLKRAYDSKPKYNTIFKKKTKHTLNRGGSDIDKKQEPYEAVHCHTRKELALAIKMKTKDELIISKIK